MRLFLFPVIVWLLLNIGIDWYIYRIIAQRLKRYPWVKWVHAVFSLLCLAVIIVAVSLPFHTGNDDVLRAVNWLLYIYLTVYISKYVFIIIDLISKIPCLFGKKRIKTLGRIGVGLSVLLFLLFWWGALINRFLINVKEIEVEIPGLPENFEGYRLLQFSDFHVGTYGSDTTFVAKVVGKINELKPDGVYFTGDIVNRRSEELRPFVATLSRIEAPDGVVSILGNHDYGDYYNWKSPLEKVENMEMLEEMYSQMDWKLLRNQTLWIHRGNDSIAVIGVENIGEPPFPVYGSLLASYKDLSDDNTKILLSHNPSHWVDSISNNNSINVPLTLSGHTHAMQISIGGWSPASMRYKTWGGKYADKKNEHQLYVNIGLGEVGMPMRLGATPELTVITLKRKDD